MTAGAPGGSMDLATFARTYDVRAPRIAWFLGAGASVAAGIATAGQMTRHFKALVYATEKAISLAGLDLADPSVNRRIQSYFSSDPSTPREGTDEEYSYYFERAYPSAADRRGFIEKAIATGRPGFGHTALAALMAVNKVGVIWTTNFDRLVEDAGAAVLGTTRTLTVGTLDSVAVATAALTGDRFPFYGKIHGDFQSDRLKNLSSELQNQDATLRAGMAATAGRFGLAIAGYSGRDASVMEALRNGLKQPKPYPEGLYWFVRGDPHPVVKPFLADAVAAGVDAHLIEFETFDELLGVLLSPITLPSQIAAKLEALRPAVRLTPFRIPPTRKGTFPVVRFNALEVERFPQAARRIDCEIGGTAEVRKTFEASTARAVGHRRNNGVVAFGFDADIDVALRPHRIKSKDIAPLDPLGHSSDLGLLYDAIGRALVRDRPLMLDKRGRLIYVDPARANEPTLKPIKDVTGDLTGTIPGTTLPWSEAVEISLEEHLDRIWLVFEPSIWAARVVADDKARTKRVTFIKERGVRRYNDKSNALIAAWAGILGSAAPLAAYGLAPGDGIDAEFSISPTTAFARQEA
jgi:hypothetical protein